MSNNEILNSTFAFIIDLLTLHNNQIYTQNNNETVQETTETW